MAAITWRDVAVPSFGGNRGGNPATGVAQALAGLSDGLKQFSEQQKQANGNALLTRALGIQDPDQLRKALSSGSILQGVDVSQVDPRILQSLDSRVGGLLSQKATEQGITSSKLGDDRTRQAMADDQYKQNRLVSEDRNEDSARGQLAAQLGNTGALANLSTEDQQRIASTRSSLASAVLSRAGQQISNATDSFNLSKNKRDDTSNQTAITTADNIMRSSATVDDARAAISDMTDLDGPTRARATQYLNKTFGDLYAPVGVTPTITKTKSTGGKETGSTVHKGTDAKGKAVTPTEAESVSSPLARDALAGLGRTMAQNNSAGVVADVEKNLGDTRSAPEVAQTLSKLFPEVDAGKLSGLITEKMAKNKNLSAADVGSALSRSTTGNYWGSTRFAPGVGVDDSSFDANLTDLATGKADYMSAGNQEVRSVATGIKTADKNLSDAQATYVALQRRKESQPGIDTGKAKERLDRAQAALETAISRFQGKAEYRPIYREPPKNGRPAQNRMGNR